MTRYGESMIVPAVAVIMTAAVTLSPSSVLGEGGARRDVVRHAAESVAAERAAPSSLSKHATIMRSDGQVFRKGGNGWTCMADNPGTMGTDSICMNEPWLHFMDDLKNKKNPTITQRKSLPQVLTSSRGRVINRIAPCARIRGEIPTQLT